MKKTFHLYCANFDCKVASVKVTINDVAVEGRNADRPMPTHCPFCGQQSLERDAVDPSPLLPLTNP